MPSKLLLFCEPCAYKKIITEDDIVKNIPRKEIPGVIPYMDLETKLIKEKKSINQSTMSKCPKCGRGVILKRLPEAYTKAQNEQQKLEHEEKERLKKCQQNL